MAVAAAESVIGTKTRELPPRKELRCRKFRVCGRLSRQCVYALKRSVPTELPDLCHIHDSHTLSGPVIRIALRSPGSDETEAPFLISRPA